MLLNQSSVRRSFKIRTRILLAACPLLASAVLGAAGRALAQDPVPALELQPASPALAPIAVPALAEPLRPEGVATPVSEKPWQPEGVATPVSEERWQPEGIATPVPMEDLDPEGVAEPVPGEDPDLQDMPMPEDAPEAQWAAARGADAAAIA